MAGLGFAAGLAEGMAQGAQVAQTALYHADMIAQRRAILDERRQYHQERAAELEAMRQQRKENELDRRVAAAGRMYEGAVKMREQAEREAANWLAAHPDWNTNPKLRPYAEQLQERIDRAKAMEADALREYSGMGSRLSWGANEVAGNLADGKHGIEDADPDHLAAGIYQSTGLPHDLFLPDKEGKRPVDDIVQGIEQGLKSLPQDGGQALLQAAQPIIGQQLSHYVGRKLPDGSQVISTPQMVAAPPHPADPSHVVPVVSFTIRRPDGSVGTMTRPYLGPDQDMLAPMDQVGSARVRPWSLQDIGGYLHNLTTVAQAAQDPRVQDKLAQASPHVPSLIDLSRDMARNPPVSRPAGGELSDLDALSQSIASQRLQAKLQMQEQQARLAGLRAEAEAARLKLLNERGGAGRAGREPKTIQIDRGDPVLGKPPRFGIYDQDSGKIVEVPVVPLTPSKAAGGGSAPQKSTEQNIDIAPSAFSGSSPQQGGIPLPEPDGLVLPED